MAKYTSKLNLKKPEANDFYNVEDSNGNFDKIDEFATRTDNPHNVTKAQVGLGNVDNTSDADKPISTAQATAINEARTIATNAKTSADIHATSRNNPHNVTADLVKAPKMFTYADANTYATVLDACNALKYGGGFVASSFSAMSNASDYPKKGFEFAFSVICEANEARKTVIAYMYHGGKMNIYQRNIFNGAWETTWNSTDESYYGNHNLPYPAQIQTGSYVGNGTYDSASPCKLDFNFTPKIVEVHYYENDSSTHSHTTFIYNVRNSMSHRTVISSSNTTRTSAQLMVTWGDKWVQWYNHTTASNQLNVSGYTYHYIAIG